MGKKQKGRVNRNAADQLDKPDWAADLFKEEKRKKPSSSASKAESETTEVTVKDRLSRGVVDKLAALKATMKETDVKPAQPVTKNKAAAKPPVRTEDDGESSFAELFDPVEPDDSSFEDLLKSSKLDWRSFKE